MLHAYLPKVFCLKTLTSSALVEKHAQVSEKMSLLKAFSSSFLFLLSHTGSINYLLLCCSLILFKHWNKLIWGKFRGFFASFFDQFVVFFLENLFSGLGFFWCVFLYLVFLLLCHIWIIYSKLSSFSFLTVSPFFLSMEPDCLHIFQMPQ